MPLRIWLILAATVVMAGFTWLFVRQPEPLKSAPGPVVRAAVRTTKPARHPSKPESPEAKLDRWMREGRDWDGLTKNNEFFDLHEAAFAELIRDTAWKRKLKQAGALARQAAGESGATPENTAIHFEFDRIFARPADLRAYAAALLANDKEAVAEIFLTRMWATASEQQIADEPVGGGMNAVPR